ncbi:MAG: hypothetical protein JWO67_4002 [Streptosporangiaceae bacterium]|nr:hypothetical protein [Streptosporangiaceae bacterium]
MTLGRLGGVYALLHASHMVGDHWVQTNPEAQRKGDEGPEGRKACAMHVATLTATQVVFLAAGALAAGERLNPRRVVIGLAVNAVSHYAADRRGYGVLPKLADMLAWTGKDQFYELGDGKAAPCGTGAYALDQSWHVGFLAVAAAIIGGGRRD